MKQLIIIFLGLLFFSTYSFAYYVHHATGDLVEPMDFTFTSVAQQVTDPSSGLNLIGLIDSGFTEDTNIRGLIGIGDKDFQIGGFYKWVPIPDYSNQPAMGLLTGFSYMSESDTNELNVRLQPFISKKFESNIGEFNSYLALPLGLRKFDGGSNVPAQLTIGTELNSRHFDNIVFTGEIGLNLRKSFTYFSIGAVFSLSLIHI